MNINKGIVIKKLADDFWIKEENNNVIKCKSRGSLKDNGIFVGDNVEFTLGDGTNTIEKILERKNLLIRPPIANIDQLMIVISPIPKPDFFIVDKLILFAYSYGIEPVLVVNKQDVSKELNDYIQKAYSSFINIIYISAKTGENIDKLKDSLRGKISAFAGQSAVGKSALVNLLFKDERALEGQLSKKINRGKNTTRHCEIHFDEDIMITDTAGFTSLDEKLLPIAYYELPYYYPDYNVVKGECKYTSCMHYNEPLKDCMVKQKVKSGEFDKERYLRYKKMYEILEQKWVKTHG